MTILGKLWFGLYSLPKAFWGFYCGGFFVVYFAIATFMLAFKPSINLTSYIAGLAILWAYMFIASVGVWRSATLNFRSPIWMGRVWAVMARTVVILAAISWAWRLANNLGLLSL